MTITTLTVRQPWAWCLVHGHKPVENRSWKTNIRGWVAIHAAKATPLQDDCDSIVKRFGLVLPDDFETGRIVGFVKIVDCVDDYDSDWFSGPFGFVLGDAVAWGGPAIRGRLGFYPTPLPDNLQYPASIKKRVSG